jgi:lysine 6-dehydrogenase
LFLQGNIIPQTTINQNSSPIKILILGSGLMGPAAAFNAMNDPQVALKEGERDITVLRVEVKGEKEGHPHTSKVELVDRYDEATGFTSMARTTAFTGATVARMIARGEIPGRGLLTPEQVITGSRFERLVAELAAAKVEFIFATEY